MNRIISRLKKKLDGRTQKELAAELGVTPAHVCYMLSGKRIPGPKILAKLGLKRSVKVSYGYRP